MIKITIKSSTTEEVTSASILHILHRPAFARRYFDSRKPDSCSDQVGLNDHRPICELDAEKISMIASPSHSKNADIWRKPKKKMSPSRGLIDLHLKSSSDF